jgi:Na+-translocating ferredoxin:NAD+ oxidoreductase RNF subunit RnfB
MFDAIIIFSVLSLILGLILGYAAIKFKLQKIAACQDLPTLQL